MDVTASPEEFAQAIRVVYHRLVWLPRRLLALFVERASDQPVGFRPPRTLMLTNREKDVLKTLVLGLSNREIAAALGMSERTVKAHLVKLMSKLGVKNRVALTVQAVQLSLVSLPKNILPNLDLLIDAQSLTTIHG